MEPRGVSTGRFLNCPRCGLTIEPRAPAVVEAEYAALDAVLARMDAEQLSSQADTTA
jgi:hypothetical protein